MLLLRYGAHRTSTRVVLQQAVEFLNGATSGPHEVVVDNLQLRVLLEIGVEPSFGTNRFFPSLKSNRSSD